MSKNVFAPKFVQRYLWLTFLISEMIKNSYLIPDPRFIISELEHRPVSTFAGRRNAFDLKSEIFRKPAKWAAENYIPYNIYVFDLAGYEPHKYVCPTWKRKSQKIFFLGNCDNEKNNNWFNLFGINCCCLIINLLWKNWDP